MSKLESLSPLPDYPEIKVYSNFDHQESPNSEQRLREEKLLGTHAAQNFYGFIWFQDNKFHEQVWIHHSSKAEFESESLLSLIEEVNSNFGYN